MTQDTKEINDMNIKKRPVFRSLVNLENCPRPSNYLLTCTPTEITLGDMHGNAIKFIYLLIEHGIFEAMKEEDYASLKDIYKKESTTLTKEDVENFIALLRALKKNENSSVRLLRLIGDLLFDRGSNDYFTLAIFMILHEKDIPFEVLISNHDALFIVQNQIFLSNTYAEVNSEENIVLLVGNFSDEDSIIFNRLYSAICAYRKFYPKGSYEGLNALLMTKTVSLEEFRDMLDRSYYLQSLKAVSYTLSPDEKSITVFTHAIATYSDLMQIAKNLNIPIEGDDPVSFAKMLDGINDDFRKKMEENFLSIYDPSQPESKDLLNERPYIYLMWNRDFNVETTTPSFLCTMVHGHDHNERENNYSIDNYLGLPGEMAEEELENTFISEYMQPNHDAKESNDSADENEENPHEKHVIEARKVSTHLSASNFWSFDHESENEPEKSSVEDDANTQYSFSRRATV